jgi:hypothetical protein
MYNVCVCVCVCVRARIFSYAWVWVCAHTCMYLCIFLGGSVHYALSCVYRCVTCMRKTFKFVGVALCVEAVVDCQFIKIFYIHQNSILIKYHLLLLFCGLARQNGTWPVWFFWEPWFFFFTAYKSATHIFTPPVLLCVLVTSLSYV